VKSSTKKSAVRKGKAADDVPASSKRRVVEKPPMVKTSIKSGKNKLADDKPRRRGRPPKSKTSTKSGPKSSALIPKKRGRPPKMEKPLKKVKMLVKRKKTA
jgi:hypothetical protein